MPRTNSRQPMICRMTPSTALSGAAAGFQRVEQADVEIRRDDGVPEPRLTGNHRVLAIAKRRQGMGDEMVEHLQRLSPVGGETEGARIAEIGAEPRLDQVEHLVDHRVWLELRRRWRLQVIGRGLAVAGTPLGERRLHCARMQGDQHRLFALS